MAAVTREKLTELGISEEAADEIVKLHRQQINRMKNEIDELTDKLNAATQAPKDGSKPEAKDGEGEAAKDSGAVNAEIETLKQQIADMQKAAKDKEVKEAKTAAYKELLKESGITNEKRIAAILKVTDFDGVKLGKDGTITNKDDLTTGIKNDYEAFIETVETKGAETANPPKGEETKKDEPNQRFIDRIAAHRASLYGEQPQTTEGG